MSKVKTIETVLVNGVYTPKNTQSMTNKISSKVIVNQHPKRIARRQTKKNSGLVAVEEMLQGAQGFVVFFRNLIHNIDRL